MSKETTVFLDMDGTINDFQEHFIDYVETVMGLHYDTSKCNSYDLEKGVMVKNKKKVKISVFDDPYFWENIRVIPESISNVEWLNNTYNLFITTTPWNTENMVTKIEWLKRNFPFIKESQVIFSDKKWDLNGDVIIEDCPATVKKCIEHDMLTITKSQPYNIDIISDEFLYNWNDIQKVMSSIDKKLKERNN